MPVRPDIVTDTKFYGISLWDKDLKVTHSMYEREKVRQHSEPAENKQKEELLLFDFTLIAAQKFVVTLKICENGNRLIRAEPQIRIS
jgi:hypothetical protein